jgi:hypothetical protein
MSILAPVTRTLKIIYRISDHGSEGTVRLSYAEGRVGLSPALPDLDKTPTLTIVKPMNTKKPARPDGIEARDNDKAPLSTLPYGIHRKGSEFIVFDKNTGRQLAVEGSRKDARQRMKTLSKEGGKPMEAPKGGSNSMTQDSQGVATSRVDNPERSTRGGIQTKPPTKPAERIYKIAKGAR